MGALADRFYIEVDAGGVILLAAIAFGAAFLLPAGFPGVVSRRPDPGVGA